MKVRLDYFVTYKNFLLGRRCLSLVESELSVVNREFSLILSDTGRALSLVLS